MMNFLIHAGMIWTIVSYIIVIVVQAYMLTATYNSKYSAKALFNLVFAPLTVIITIIYSIQER